MTVELNALLYGLCAMCASIVIPYCFILIKDLNKPHWTETLKTLRPKHPDDEAI